MKKKNLFLPYNINDHLHLPFLSLNKLQCTDLLTFGQSLITAAHKEKLDITNRKSPDQRAVTTCV